MPEYNGHDFDPPAPFAKVVIRDISGSRAVHDVPLIVDTGANVMLLPRLALESLSVPITNETGYMLSGFDGSQSVARATTVAVELLGKIFRGKFLITDQSYGILDATFSIIWS